MLSESIASLADRIFRDQGKTPGPSSSGKPAELSTGQWAANHYRFADILFSLSSDNSEFKSRFERIFSECKLETQQNQQSDLQLSTRAIPGKSITLVQLIGSGQTDNISFLKALFPEQGFKELAQSVDCWRLLSSTGSNNLPVLALNGNDILADNSFPWYTIVAHFAIATAMRIQPENLFFHGATNSIAGKGVLLFGDKGAGKTTLSLALAAKGHGFLGDEYATVNSVTGVLIPFRRAVSIRQGPQAPQIARYVTEHHGEMEILADGSSRTRFSVKQLLPDLPGSRCPLSHAFFLQKLADKPGATFFNMALQQLEQTSPLLGTIWDQSSARCALKILNVFRSVRCYRLTPGGTPAETAKLIENILEQDKHVSQNKS